MKRFSVKLICLIVAALLLVCGTSSCAKPPELDSVKDTFIALIEESKEINEIFFGVGLPVYGQEDSLSEAKKIYLYKQDLAYDYVIDTSPYFSIQTIKDAAERVYSEEYLAEIYESAFEGVLVGDSAYIRYYEDSDWIYQSVEAKPGIVSERIYDYSTMEIVKPYDENYANVSIMSRTVDDEKEIEVTLSFIYERGNWYLDSPTY